MAGFLISVSRLAALGISVIAVFFASTLTFFYLTAPDWSTEVAFRATLDTRLDMAIDSEGNPNVASADYSLRFSKKTDMGWNTTTLVEELDYNFYSGVSIALDSKDNAYICAGYTTVYTYPGLIVATDRDGDWTVEELVPLEYYQYISSRIAVDDEGSIHMLCSCAERIDYDPQTAGYDYYAGHVLHIHETPDGWEHSEIFAPAPNSTSRVHSFRIGEGNIMHALLETEVYADATYFEVTSRSFSYVSTLSGNWTQEVVASIGPESISETRFADARMAIDDDGKAHICRYVWDSPTASYSIAYMTNKGGEWLLSNLSYAGNSNPSSCSIDLDSTGSVHIAYYAHYSDINISRVPEIISNCTLRYVTDVGGSWKQEILDDKEAWRNHMIRVAIGSDDVVQIAYVAYLPLDSGGDDYNVLHSTPVVGTETLGRAATSASLYTLAFSLVVGVVAIIYLRKREGKARI